MQPTRATSFISQLSSGDVTAGLMLAGAALSAVAFLASTGPVWGLLAVIMLLAALSFIGSPQSSVGDHVVHLSRTRTEGFGNSQIHFREDVTVSARPGTMWVPRYMTQSGQMNYACALPPNSGPAIREPSYMTDSQHHAQIGAAPIPRVNRHQSINLEPSHAQIGESPTSHAQRSNLGLRSNLAAETPRHARIRGAPPSTAPGSSDCRSINSASSSFNHSSRVTLIDEQTSEQSRLSRPSNEHGAIGGAPTNLCNSYLSEKHHPNGPASHATIGR